MKNSRWSRLTAWLVTLVMVLTFSALTAVCLAEGGAEGGAPSGQEEKTKETTSETIVSSITLATPPEVMEDVTANAAFSLIGADGMAVASPADMDPNQANTLRISLSGLSTEVDPSETPVLTVTLPEYVKATAADAEALISSEVTGRLGENGRLELRWVGDRAEAVTVELPIIPNAPAAKDLSGTYMLAAANGSMLGAQCYDNNKLTASWVRQVGSMYYTETEEKPFWTLTHVSGDYYTVRAANTSDYLMIQESDKGLYLVPETEETAQKFKLIDRGGGKYSFTYKNLSINNYGNNAMNGFGAWDIQNANNANLLLYPTTVLSDGPLQDKSGTWYIVINNRILGAGTRENGRLDSVSWVKYDNDRIPKDNVTTWTFNHIIHDWYTVESEYGYLNIRSDGVYVSDDPQHLVVKYNGNNTQFALSNGEFDKRSQMLKMVDDKSMSGFGIAGNGINGQTQITLESPDNIAFEQTQISGNWAIGNESTGGVILNEMSGTRLASDSFIRTGAQSVTVPGKEVAIWTFTKIDGNWYTIQNQNGLYLKLLNTNGSVDLSPSEEKVYVQSYNGKYRFINESGYALNNYDHKSTGGFTSYNSGDGKGMNEWHSLYSVSETAADILIFNANGGSVAGTPAAIVADPGTVITLPDYTGSRQNERFIGWAETNAFYKNISGTNYNYHELYKPGTSYTVKSGTTTLYAVWDNKVKKVSFFIRKDEIIHDEPSDYPNSDYTGGLEISDALDEGYWILDLDGNNAVSDYYVNNAVMANLRMKPSLDQITAWLKKEKVTFDPETMYIHFYVLKSTGEGSQWHVDGVIRTKTKVGLSYNTNVPAAEKFDVKNMPGGAQVEPGTELLIGADKNGSEIKTPEREGYVFRGWNTAADGSGTDYTEGHYVVLTRNLNLYAQWVEASEGKLVIMVESDWPAGKPAYAETEITLKAVLTGFENKDYTLQWQYSPDNRETWVDIPGANGMTDTY